MRQEHDRFSELNDTETAQLKMEETCKKVFGMFQSVDESNVMRMIDVSFVSCNAERKEITVRFRVQKWELNPNGVMHGGVIATCFDTAFGLLTRVVSGHTFISTIDLSVNYLRPIYPQDDFVVIARAMHAGKTVVQVTADGFVGDQMVAASRASFILMKPKSE